MGNLNNIPQLRFPEFKVEWENKKNKDLVSRVSFPVDVKKDELYTQIGIRSHGKGIFHKEPVTGKSLGNKRVFWVQKDMFIVNIVFAWELAVAKTTENEDGLIASHRFPMYQAKEDVSNVDYLLHYFLTRKGKYLLEMASPGGAGRNKTLGQKEFENLKYLIPTFEEQTKIANFLTAVDNRINILQEKKAELELYKKGVMQKIFKQEVRFKDDDGNNYPDWEEKKLGEIGTFQTSSVDKLSSEDEKQIFLVNYMNVYRHESINNSTRSNLQVVTAKDKQIQSSDLRKGDILFTPSSESPSDIGHSVVIFEDLEDTLFSYHLMRFRPSIQLDLLYSHYFCNIDSVLKQLSRYATGSTRFTISVGNFSKIKVQLPTFDEQQKIANFLSSIDNSIDKVNKQIDESLTYKQGLLQKMFV